ncbi:Protein DETOXIFICATION 41 [Asimina triloba]
MNYLNWDIQFVLGFFLAASIRVSNELGAGHPKLARFSVFVVLATSISVSTVFSVIVLVLRTPLSQLFTSDESVIKAVSNLTPLLALSIFLNGIQSILSGVAIGSGWQALVAYVNLTTYYVIGLPVGCVIGFKTSLRGAGIWWGMILGIGLQATVLVTLTARTNWNKEVEKAIDRLKKSASEETQSLVDTVA